MRGNHVWQNLIILNGSGLKADISTCFTSRSCTGSFIVATSTFVFLHHRFNIFFLFLTNMLLSIFYFYFSLFCFQFKSASCIVSIAVSSASIFLFKSSFIRSPHHPFKTYILPITSIILLVYSFSILFFPKERCFPKSENTFYSFLLI